MNIHNSAREFRFPCQPPHNTGAALKLLSGAALWGCSPGAALPGLLWSLLPLVYLVTVREAEAASGEGVREVVGR